MSDDTDDTGDTDPAEPEELEKIDHTDKFVWQDGQLRIGKQPKTGKSMKELYEELLKQDEESEEQ